MSTGKKDITFSVSVLLLCTGEYFTEEVDSLHTVCIFWEVLPLVNSGQVTRRARGGMMCTSTRQTKDVIITVYGDITRFLKMFSS